MFESVFNRVKLLELWLCCWEKGKQTKMKFVSLDETEILAKFQERAEKLWRNIK